MQDSAHALPGARPRSVARHHGLVALGLLAGVYLALYGGYMQIPDAVLIEVVYHDAIVGPATFWIHVLSGHDTAHAVGNQIVSGGTVLAIVRGCDGAGVLFLLIAAIVATRASLKRTVSGIVGAWVFVYLINQVRIVVLYFAIVGHPDWFVPLHSFVFPTLFVLTGLACFTVWSPGSGARSHGSSRPA